MLKASLNSFPVELLQEIVQLTSSLPILRRVCRKFNDVIVPQLFSHATIRFKEGKQNEFLEYLEALATRAHVAQVHARVLTILDLSPSLTRPGILRYPPDELDQEEDLKYQLQVLDPYYARSQVIEEWLPLAISSYRNVTRVVWEVNNRSHTWSRDSVVSGLARMASLKTLALNVNTYQELEASIQLRSLPPLQELAINAQYSATIADDGTIRGVPELIAKSSSQLLHLAIEIRNHQDTDSGLPFLDSLLQSASPLHITHLRLQGFFVRLANMTLASHLRSLVSLQLQNATMHNRGPYLRDSLYDSPAGKYSAADIWDVLRQENIYLREIELDEPTMTFIQYLKSYSGLKSLVITGAASFTAEEANRLARNFYHSALTTHAKSIERLEISAAYEGLWCFGNHCINTLTALVTLKYLTISIIADSGEVVSAMGTFIFDLSESNTAQPPPCSYDPTHPVCSLIEIVSALPVLNVLTIRGADLERNRGVWCGNGIMCHTIPASRQIDTHVRSIGPLDPTKYRFAIVADHKHYALRQSEEDGEFRYFCVRDFSTPFPMPNSWSWPILDRD